MSDEKCIACAGIGQHPVFDQRGFVTHYQVCPICFGTGRKKKKPSVENEGCSSMILVIVVFGIMLRNVFSANSFFLFEISQYLIL